MHGERVIYDSEWIRLALADVELPSGKRFEHHVVRMPYVAAGTVVDDPDRGVLLLWRHRFTTDTWGWEIPGGRVDEGETPAEAATRETVEEAGWRPGPLTLMTAYYPHNGISDMTFHLFAATSAVYVGEPTESDEAERVEWLGVARRARRAAGRPRRRRAVVDGAAVAARRWGLRDRWQTDGMNSGHVGVDGQTTSTTIDDIDDGDDRSVTVSTRPAAAAATETSVIRTTRSCCPGGSTRSTSPSSS